MPSAPTGGPPGMPGCGKGMLGGGGDAILLSVMPRPSISACSKSIKNVTGVYVVPKV
jgi:hypothetical protein